MTDATVTLVERTLLFSDIEGSTQLWERVPQRMAELLALHDERIRRCVDDHRGSLLKHTGDGVIAVFETPGQAVRCAVAMQHALIDLGDGQDALRIRIGIHAGVVQKRDDDLFGPVMNRAARIMSTAHGGQIVVSELVRLSIEHDPATAPAVRLVALGLHRLKGLAAPEPLHQLTADGLRDAFPPPASLNTTVGNLPSFPDDLVNRLAELAELTEVLPARPLVTIVGPGGVGKTRLALHAARAAAATFPDGVWFVDLASIQDATIVSRAVAAALSVAPRGDQSINATLRDALHARRALLILDNCEHVHDAVVDLLRAVCVGDALVRVLCTSQIPLGIASEHLVRVGPLVVPDDGAPADLVALRALPSVVLFERRAALADPTFAVTVANCEAVADICRHLDGLPLAIELAAARCQVLTPEAIAGRLDRRFALLRSRHGDERHRTLLATVQWSYDLLTPEEQTLFAVLGLFQTSADLDAIAHAADSDELDVVDLLDALVDKSLLSAVRTTTGVTYRFLETTRQFALDRLDERADADATRARYVDWFADLGTRARAGLLSDDAPAWLDRLTRQLPDIRACVLFLLASDHRRAARLVCDLEEMWLSRDIYGDAQAWLSMLGDSLAGEPIAVEIDTLLAALSWIAGDNLRSEQAADRALTLAQALGMRASRAAARLAVLRIFQGRVGDSLAYVEEARASIVNDDDAAQAVLGVIGVVVGFCGDTSLGRQLCEEGVAVSGGFGPIRTATALANLETFLGGLDPDRSIEVSKEGVRLGRLIGSKSIEALALLAEAQARRARKDRAGTLAAVTIALPLLRDSGRRQMVVMAVEMANREFVRAAPESAVAIWAATARLRTELGEQGTPLQNETRTSQAEMLRSNLGDEAFDSAWRRGESMTLDGLVDMFCTVAETLHLPGLPAE
jgi:predicted ATPase/class 3 adenylate cyclase